MTNKVVRLYTPPKATLADPYAQVKWMFFQVESEHDEPTAAGFRYAKNKYIQFLNETNAYYPELEANPRFFLEVYWEADALIRFNKWLSNQDITSKTRYSIYKTVRQVMDMAYALRVIDRIVYHAPMFKGVSETKTRSAYAEEEQEVINAAVAKWIGLSISVLRGYRPTGEGIPYRRKNCLPAINIDGQLYDVAGAAKRFGVAQGTITQRLKQGWTPRQSVGLDRSPSQERSSRIGDIYSGKEMAVEGVNYRSVNAVAAAYGLDGGIVRHRLRKGYSIEQAVGLTPMRVLQKDERALLWSFENEYGHDASKMLSEFNRRKLTAVCTEKRLLNLFSRWGVWPHVDDRLVMPLVVEMAMLTGLNVEALKMLEVDSYRREHGLTGQPVITYRKKRSGSTKRSEVRELHLPVLELEDLFLDGEVVEKVHRLVNQVLVLTSKIRRDAPAEISNRLFIFEDVELSRKMGVRIVVPLDPKGKAGQWYEKFCREEGLYAIFGPEFSFNISRCRPTLATNMVLAGADLFQVQIALGHESIQTTATYLDEQRLKPAFNRTVSEALRQISSRSTTLLKIETPKDVSASGRNGCGEQGFHETLSGCGCTNPYAPSEHVRRLTKHTQGSVCKFWNMCLLCDSAVITESSLPKLVVYRNRVAAALNEDSPAIRSRKELFQDVVKLIDGILVSDTIFPASTIESARSRAATMNDLLVDQLIYQGL